ncbi:uncharacterized protein VTP21DRAFT_8524 [Calcarisporiella thermophila]|uniref:uncharacterized protein n=1 Tax=Calcarisporiella thermophila TaxID=911321 RepID=UPI003742E188
MYSANPIHDRSSQSFIDAQAQFHLTEDSNTAKTRAACTRCRRYKVRCDGDGEHPCSRCQKIDSNCFYAPPSRAEACERLKQCIDVIKAGLKNLEKPSPKPKIGDRPVACVRCRSLKARCDFQTPVCGRCKSMSKICSYSHPLPAPKVRDAYSFQALSDCLNHLSTWMERLESDNDLNINSSRRSFSSDESSNGENSSTASAENDSPLKDAGESAELPLADENLSLVPASAFSPPKERRKRLRAEPSSFEWVSTSATAGRADSMASLVTFREQTILLEGLKHSLSATSIVPNRTGQQKTALDMLARFWTDGCHVFPSHFATFLLDSFEQSFYLSPFYSVGFSALQKTETFMQLLNNPALNSICAVQLGTPHNFLHIDKNLQRKLSNLFLERAEKFLFSSQCINRPSPAMVYALANLARQRHYVSQSHQAGKYLAQGFKLAKRLGMHRKRLVVPNEAMQDPMGAELRKRIFWYLVGVDCFSAVFSGHPLVFDQIEIDQDLPMKLLGEDEVRFSIFHGFASLFLATRIILLRAHAEETPSVETMLAFDNMLDDTYENLPSCLRFPDTSSGDASAQFSASLSCLTYFYTLRIVLHKPFLPSYRWSDPANFTGAVEHSFSMCMAASSHILKMADALSSRKFPKGFITPVLLTADLHMRNALSLDQQRRALGMDALRQCLGILERTSLPAVLYGQPVNEIKQFLTKFLDCPSAFVDFNAPLPYRIRPSRPGIEGGDQTRDLDWFMLGISIISRRSSTTPLEGQAQYLQQRHSLVPAKSALPPPTEVREVEVVPSQPPTVPSFPPRFSQDYSNSPPALAKAGFSDPLTLNNMPASALTPMLDGESQVMLDYSLSSGFSRSAIPPSLPFMDALMASSSSAPTQMPSSVSIAVEPRLYAGIQGIRGEESVENKFANEAGTDISFAPTYVSPSIPTLPLALTQNQPSQSYISAVYSHDALGFEKSLGIPQDISASTTGGAAGAPTQNSLAAGGHRQEKRAQDFGFWVAE